MTNTDNDIRETSPVRRLVLLVTGSFLALFAAATFAGMIAGAASAGGTHSPLSYAVLAAVGLVGAGGIWLAWRNRAVATLPASPRMRKQQVLLYACLGIGVALGAAMVIVEGPENTDLLSLFAATGPVSPTAAIILVISFLIVTGLSARWHMLLDEHERAAYDFGAVAGIYTYFVVSICWWMLGRAALVPPVDGFAIFWLVMLVWMIAWLIRRYR